MQNGSKFRLDVRHFLRSLTFVLIEEKVIETAECCGDQRRDEHQLQRRTNFDQSVIDQIELFLKKIQLWAKTFAHVLNETEDRRTNERRAETITLRNF